MSRTKKIIGCALFEKDQQIVWGETRIATKKLIKVPLLRQYGVTDDAWTKLMESLGNRHIFEQRFETMVIK